MKITIINILILLSFFSLLLSSCEDNPMDEEQYFKQVYIVGAAQIVSQFDVYYKSEATQAYVSVATGGSLNIDKDVVVNLEHNDETIDWYNKKYMIDAPVKYQKLDAAHYNIPSMTTTIRSGEVYSRLPFTINTGGLHCDSLYALTFKIVSVSEFQKNGEDTVLVMNLKMVNDYSGSYQADLVRYTVVANSSGEVELTLPTTISATRTLTAVDQNTVRFFNEAKAEIRSGYSTNEDYFNGINKYCVTLKKGEGQTFIVAPWNQLDIVNPGECTYKDGTFTYWYDYKDGSTTFRIQGRLVK